MPEKTPEPEGTPPLPFLPYTHTHMYVYMCVCVFHLVDGDSDQVEEERHKAFQALRKKHYEMKDAIKLGHQLEEEESDDDPDRSETSATTTMVNGHQ